MREGDFHPIQHDPTVMSISVNELLNGCNGFLRIKTGFLVQPLHRHCTVSTLGTAKIGKWFRMRASRVRFLISHDLCPDW